MKDTYDFVVIGGGSAGYAGASTAARHGLQTLVVEGGAQVGGLCILRGCMPSKALLEIAHRAEGIRRAGEFGLRAEYFGADGPAIIARKRRLVEEFAGYRQGQLQTGAFDFVRARARFLDPHTVELAGLDGSVVTVKAKFILIATGSRLNRVDIPGLEETGCLESDHVMESDQIPDSVFVLGGGAIALELASYYRGLGTEVTLVQRGAHFLREMDPDVSDAIADAFRKRGIRVFSNTALVRVEREGAQKRVVFHQGGEKRSVQAQEIVYALGRKPLTEGLNLEAAGLGLAHGGLGTNASQQTLLPHIFAAGDVCGPFEVVHLAIQQGEVAARNAAHLLKGQTEALERIDYRLKLFAVFSQPEVASVGLTGTEAEALGLEVLSASYAFNDLGKAMVAGETEGFVKLICAKEGRKILGGMVVGPSASELIHEIVVAMHFGATAGDLARIPHYHPTLSEIWTYPAEELAG